MLESRPKCTRRHAGNSTSRKDLVGDRFIEATSFLEHFQNNRSCINFFCTSSKINGDGLRSSNRPALQPSPRRLSRGPNSLTYEQIAHILRPSSVEKVARCRQSRLTSASSLSDDSKNTPPRLFLISGRAAIKRGSTRLRRAIQTAPSLVCRRLNRHGDSGPPSL